MGRMTINAGEQVTFSGHDRDAWIRLGMSADDAEALADLSAGFMVPQVMADRVGECCHCGAEIPWSEPEHDCTAPMDERFADDVEYDRSEHHTGPQWWARLSAPGDLDYTDWGGPFPSVRSACASLARMYGEV